MRRRPEIPFYYWLLWIPLIGIGLFIFYVLLTPVWMGVRLIAWLAEGRRSRV